MGFLAEKPRYTVAEYLRIEKDALEKHELMDGEMLSMAGGSINHSLIVANVIRSLGNALVNKPCRVFDSNLRVRIPRTIFYTYPDVTIICGKPEPDPEDASGQTVINPRLIVEVLSDSTEAYDRGEKFLRYLQLDSLEEYLLISQHTRRVEIFRRLRDGGWFFEHAGGMDGISKLTSIETTLALKEIYSGVEFAPSLRPA